MQEGEIIWKKPHREQNKADYSATDSLLRDLWPHVCEWYPAECTYNVDETGLYYRAIPPEISYMFKNKKTKKAKQCKD